jgi:pre-mRNA-splicing factor 18
MDFAALMSQELLKSKKSGDSDKKYMKRADVEAERRAAYLAEQKKLEEEREAKAAAKRKREDEAAAEKEAREAKRKRLAEESRKQREEREWEEEQARRRRLGLPEKTKSDAGLGDGGDGAGADDVTDEEMAKKLRELGEPLVLFGESRAARVRRYRKLTTVMTKGPIPTTLELVEEKDMRVDRAVPKDKDGRKYLFRQLASYFTMVLTAYEQAMEAEKRDTTASKTAYNTMVQTRENMKPVSSEFDFLPTKKLAQL